MVISVALAALFSRCNSEMWSHTGRGAPPRAASRASRLLCVHTAGGESVKIRPGRPASNTVERFVAAQLL